jgi:hypothetical protein
MSDNPEVARFADAVLKQCAQAIEAAPEDDLAIVIANVERARQAKATCEDRIRVAHQKLPELLGTDA